jgi:hypothetical protein
VTLTGDVIFPFCIFDDDLPQLDQRPSRTISGTRRRRRRRCSAAAAAFMGCQRSDENGSGYENARLGSSSARVQWDDKSNWRWRNVSVTKVVRMHKMR